MTEPVVCCVMLVNGREAMVRRAVASFEAQTYANKRLVIYDNGSPPSDIARLAGRERELLGNYMHATHPESLGTMRNHINRFALFGRDGSKRRADIVAHWDSDDWSHPNRLAEQVAMLQHTTGADAVGYCRAAFWHEEQQKAYTYTGLVPHTCLVGASLMYWREVWERNPFDDVMRGSDTRFVRRIKALGVDGIHEACCHAPRIICAIHADSTTKGTPNLAAREWKRAEDLDAYCSQRMKL